MTLWERHAYSSSGQTLPLPEDGYVSSEDTVKDTLWIEYH